MKKLVLLIFLFTFGASAQRFVSTYATIADLLAAPPPGAQTNAYVLGYYNSNDGGGGPIYYDKSSSASTNFGSSLKPFNYGGRWFTPNSDGIFNAKRFGAKADGTTDDSVRLQSAIAAAYNYPKGTVFMPPGVYRGYVTMNENVRLRGNSQEGEKNSGEGSTILRLPDGLTNQSVIISTEECSIENIQIDGNKANTSGTSYGIHFNRAGIYIESTVLGVSVVNAKSAGIYVNANEITIRNSSVIESDGYGIYVNDTVWDLTLNKILLGWSGSDGLYVGNGGAGNRFTQIDSYFSRGNGVTLVNPNLMKIDRLQIDFSFLNGLEINCTAGSPALFVNVPEIYGSNANDDGRGRTNSTPDGTYSDVLVTGNNYPSSISIRDGRIGTQLSGALKKPLYSIGWSNSAAPAGWGMHLYDINVDSVNGTRTASGKSLPDSFLTSQYWNGRLINYYDGTNAMTLIRDSYVLHKHNYVDPPALTVYSNTITINTNVVVVGTMNLSGASSGRTINVPALGMQIKGSPGYPAIGVSSFNETAVFGTESSTARLQLDTVTGNSTMLMNNTRASGTDKAFKVAYTLNQTGTAGSVGASIESTTTALGSGTHYPLSVSVNGIPRLTTSLGGQLRVISSNGIPSHAFVGDTSTDSQIYLWSGQTLDRRLTLKGNALDVTSTDGSTVQTLELQSNTGLVNLGGYLRTASGIQYGSATRFDRYGSGSPEGIVTADISSTWRRTDGGSSTSFYVKESGSGNTGWVAYGPPGGSGVSITGTPTSGQIAEWTSGSSIQGVTATGTGSPVKATAPTLPSTVTIGAAGGTTGAALFKGTTSGTVTLSVADAAGTHTIKLPVADGSANQVLKTDGSGQWGWTTAPGGGAPSTADYLVRTADAGLSAERVVTDTTSITVDWGTSGQAKFVREALTGDVTAAQNSNATTIANDAVSNAKAANMAASTIKARVTGSTGDPEDATLSQVLDLVGSAANGDMLVRSGGSWGRLAAPTQLSGSQLYYGPNGVEWVNSATHFIHRSDFQSQEAAYLYGAFSSSGTTTQLATESGAVGVIQLSSGTASTTYRHVYLGANNTFNLGRGRTIVTIKARIPVLSDATDTFDSFIGIYDAASTIVDGAWFQNSHGVNSGNWQCKVANNSSTTTFNSSTAATTSWVTFTIDSNAGATEVKFYINGSLVHTESGSNIPDSSRATSVAIGLNKTAGSTNARTLLVDFIDVYVQY